MKKTATALAFVLLLLCGCGKKQPEPANPYEGMVQVPSGAGTMMWVEEYETVEVSAFERIDFVVGGDRMEYTGGEYTALTGIDVSEHQREVDWQRVKADGIDFAVIRLGYRGYSEGGIFIDPFFEANFTGAADAGVQRGVYFFSQAITPDEAKEEARTVIETLAGRELDLPVYYDWETIDNPEARTNGLDGTTLTQCAIAFCEEIKAAGYTPGVYTNRHVGYFMYILDQIDDYEFWMSTDGDYPDFYYAHSIWQYSFTGKVDGVNGYVDMNMRFTKNESAE
ncbi:MAG: glycoside hydrolase family 25 protein [Oscillospiraceae bacterium]|nr:glycoside hydrolase family 25 protein [Oscillospiraceae bacterium]